MYWSTIFMIGSLVFSAARISSRTRPRVVSCAGAADLDLQHAGQVLRAGENFVARLLVHRQRFAGDGGLVERALAGEDDAVRRHVVAGRMRMTSPTARSLAATSSSPWRRDAAGFGGGELDERFDGGARAFGGAGFDDLAHQHEEGDHAGGLVIAGGKGGEHGDGDQFVDAQDAAADVLDGGPDDRVAEDDRADQRAGAGDGVALLEEPVHDEGIEHEDDADQRLPEPHGRVLVVVAARRARSHRARDRDRARLPA